MRNIAAFIVLFAISVQCICGSTLVKSNVNPTFELTAGNCDDAVPSNLVFQQHIRRPAVPFIIQRSEVFWCGEKKIYCVLALANKEGSTVAIEDGGLNCDHVTFGLESARGKGLDYNLSIYAK